MVKSESGSIGQSFAPTLSWGIKPVKIVPVNKIPAQSQQVFEKDPVEVYKVCKEMEVLCLKHNGVGLSAVQVGLPWKLFILQSIDREKSDMSRKFRYFIDCEYESLGEEKAGMVEGCLSLPNRLFRVSRWKDFKVIGYELVAERASIPEFIDCNLTFYAQTISGTKDDRLASLLSLRHAAMQHEIDHHRNILIRDIGEEVILRQPLQMFQPKEDAKSKVLGEKNHGTDR